MIEKQAIPKIKQLGFLKGKEKIDVCHGCREPPWRNSANAQNHTCNNGDNTLSGFQATTTMASHDGGYQSGWW